MKRRHVALILVLLVGAGALAQSLMYMSLASAVEGQGGKVVVENETPEGQTVSVVFIGRPVGDADLALLRDRKDYHRLFLDSTRVQGECLQYLDGSNELRWVSLGNCPVTDDGLKNLPALPRLELLNLSQTRVTDAGLAHLARHTGLRHLLLARTAVTDTGLEHLKGLNQLEGLVVTRTNVTEAGVRRLQSLIPTLKKVQVVEDRD
jgi:hypothetical protein